MPRNTSGLRRGGGRPLGAPNKATREIKEFAREFLESEDYVRSAKQRVRKGKAPHLETLWHHYAYGKPKEVVQMEGQVPPFILKVEGGE